MAWGTLKKLQTQYEENILPLSPVLKASDALQSTFASAIRDPNATFDRLAQNQYIQGYTKAQAAAGVAALLLATGGAFGAGGVAFGQAGLAGASALGTGYQFKRGQDAAGEAKDAMNADKLAQDQAYADLQQQEAKANDKLRQERRNQALITSRTMMGGYGSRNPTILTSPLGLEGKTKIGA